MANRWDETWHRLREWTNGQAPSERLAAQILLHEGYENLDPSHPLGGKDGKKDALCKKDGQKWIMAVYFPRGQKYFDDIKNKFLSDLEGIKTNNADALAFVTNQELRLSERQKLHESAGNSPIELFHLERITVILDQPEMHGVRNQFLQIDLTEEEKAISTQYLLSLDIQRDCKLLQELLAHNEQSYLSEKWQSCFRENRGTWQDVPSRILLAQNISGEITQHIQDFYERLDNIEEKCKDLLTLKSKAQPLEAKPKYGNGVLSFGTMYPPAWAEKYITEQDAIALLASKKINAMKLKNLKEAIRTALDSGSQIVGQLSSR